jgi:hypothetical protein
LGIGLSGFGFSYKRWDHPNSLLAICGTKQDGLNYMVCWLIIDRSHRLVERSSVAVDQIGSLTGRLDTPRSLPRLQMGFSPLQVRSSFFKYGHATTRPLLQPNVFFLMKKKSLQHIQVNHTNGVSTVLRRCRKLSWPPAGTAAPPMIYRHGRFLAVQMNHHTSMSEGNTFGTRF